MRRREFITLLGGAAAGWPLAASAQQSAMPVVGYLNFGSPESDAPRLTGLRRGLNQIGYVEGRNAVIEYRWPERNLGGATAKSCAGDRTAGALWAGAVVPIQNRTVG